jgi:hypothetical protein
MNYRLIAAALVAFLMANEVKTQEESSNALLIQVPYAEFSAELKEQLPGAQSAYFVVMKRAADPDDLEQTAQHTITPFDLAREYSIEYDQTLNEEELLAIVQGVALPPGLTIGSEGSISALVVLDDGPTDYPGGGGGSWPLIVLNPPPSPLDPYPGGGGGNWARPLDLGSSELSEALLNDLEASSQIPVVRLSD